MVDLIMRLFLCTSVLYLFNIEGNPLDFTWTGTVLTIGSAQFNLIMEQQCTIQNIMMIEIQESGKNTTPPNVEST